jgi:hypothetical protein
MSATHSSSAKKPYTEDTVPHTTAVVLRQKVPEQSCDHRRRADPAEGRAAPISAFRRLEAA